MRYKSLLALACVLQLAASNVRAQTIDLALSPSLSVAEVGSTVGIQLHVLANGLLDLDYAAVDALLDYDPDFLLLVGVDDTLASEDWFASAFLPDPDGINTSISDGNALYTALGPTAEPATAPPTGAIVTTLLFVTLQETPATVVSLLPSMGVWATTEVYDYHQAGGLLTGDISSTATVQIVSAPIDYCLGEPADCPCANPGGPGGCANSSGAGALLSWSGTTSVAADDLVLHVNQLPGAVFGIFIIGGGSSSQPFGDGLLCVAPGPSGLHRFSPPNQASALGVMSRGPGLVAHTMSFPAGQEIQVGNTYYFQAWYRDPAGPCSTGWNMTNALETTFTM